MLLDAGLYLATNTVAAVGLLIFGSLGFDVIHMLAHTKIPSLAWLRKWHWTHHKFFGPDLKYDDRFLNDNIKYHLTLEAVAQLLIILVGAAWLGRPFALGSFGIVVFCLIRWVVQVVSLKGKDSHHPEIGATGGPLPAHLDNVFVGAEYHCYHHVWPDTHFGSMVTIPDVFFGTALQLKGRRVTVSGAGGAYGAAWVKLLQPLVGENVPIQTIKYGKDYTYDDFTKLVPIFEKTDILILSHGAKGTDRDNDANGTSFAAMVYMFQQICDQQKRFILPEVWAVGSEVESGVDFGCPPSYKPSKQLFARYMKVHYNSNKIMYRHIVPAAFSSAMGPGLISAMTAAKIALFFIRRGFRYIPVTYTGLALINWIRFALFVEPLEYKPQNVKLGLPTKSD